jgi:hypothetical protein
MNFGRAVGITPKPPAGVGKQRVLQSACLCAPP